MFSRPIARSALRQPYLRVAGLCTVPLCIHAARKLAASSSAHARAQILSTRRQYATPPPQVVLSDLSEDDYHHIADHTLDRMLESLEELIDTRGHPSFEVDYSSGVLTLDLGTHGKYVINKQPPNKQIWLSSPVSGPKRFDLSRETGDWVYARDKHALGVLLNEELSVAFGEDIDLGLGAEVQQSVAQRFGVELPDVKA